jgi:hypothetical protein
MARAWTAASVALAAVLLTALFWQPLWTGGGLIGGDTYTYYFPQKTFYAECLARGELPLWNPLVSLGYPQLAESQTGALSPLNLVLYRLLDVNAAYNAIHLLHAIAAYLFTWLFARRAGLGVAGAHLASVVFVYGWFPPRACLEWAIIGGAYFPLLLWCCESYLQTAARKWLLSFALGLGLFLLAGHYNLAFITLLTTALYLAGRLFWAGDGLHPDIAVHRSRTLAAGLGAVVLGFGLAGAQLLSTAELKANSQRGETYANQTYGHIPPWYLSQVLWPKLWWGDDMNPDQALWSTHWGSPPTPADNTNKIEAHLYFGVVPFYLLLIGGAYGAASGYRPTRYAMLWIGLGLAAAMMATGWPVYWLRHVPGFAFFAGPGRYGMVTTLAVALGAGSLFDALLRRRRSFSVKCLLAILIFGFTLPDLWLVSRWVTNVVMVETPPVDFRFESAVREELLKAPGPVRVWAPGENLPTLTGINCVPEYLGIGPSAYYDPERKLPRPGDSPTAEQIERAVNWLRRAGVTHILRFQPIEAGWPVDPPVVLFDRFLNAAWARGREPLYLYRLQNSRPLAFVESNGDLRPCEVERIGANRVVLHAEAPMASKVVLLDLAYPGWTVTIDGQPAEPEVSENMFRAVETPAGRHEVVWTYRPMSLQWGLGLTALSGLVWCGVAWSSRRRTSRTAVTA